MSALFDKAWPVLAVAIVTLWLSAWVGAHAFRRLQGTEGAAAAYYQIILGATLTLLSLLIGFSFSMAINHYDQRKSSESAEVNAIRAAYLRTDLLPAADASSLRSLIGNYLEQRILFYEARDEGQLHPIEARTAELQAALWSAIRASGASVPLAVISMNDMLNARSSAEAAWSNRIPLEAWILLAAIAISGNVLIGYGARKFSSKTVPILILPTVVVISIALYLIDDVDSPRGGMIGVRPENLRLLAASLADADHPLGPNNDHAIK